MPSWKTSGTHTPSNGVKDNPRMSFTVFLGNLPTWVTADDIKGWLHAENLVADAIKVIRNPETQESKGFAFIDAPNTEEMNSIIRRFDRAPLEDRLLRANPAQPPKPKSPGPIGRPAMGPSGPHSQSQGGYSPAGRTSAQPTAGQGSAGRASTDQAPAGQVAPQAADGQGSVPPPGSQAAGGQTDGPVGAQAAERPPRRGKKSNKRAGGGGGPQSPFAEELAKAL